MNLRMTDFVKLNKNLVKKNVFEIILNFIIIGRTDRYNI